MAGVYSIAQSSASVTVAANLFDLVCAATDRVRLRELGVTVGLAGASATVGVSRVTAIGTRTTPVLGQAEDAADPAASGGSAVAWSVAPTVATTYFRRVTLPATLGAGIVWSWPPGDELVIPVSLGIMVSCISLSAALATSVNVYARWVE